MRNSRYVPTEDDTAARRKTRPPILPPAWLNPKFRVLHGLSRTRPFSARLCAEAMMLVCL